MVQDIRIGVHNTHYGYCTPIGNERFAWFASTDSKSRINFLELVRAGHEAYTLNPAALAYMAEHKLPCAQLQALTALAPAAWTGQAAWQAVLAEQASADPRHVRIVTEGALLGTVVEQGAAPDLAIVSDDAGQFDVLTHALCWTPSLRQEHLHRVVNNARFLILPWIECKNLASSILACAAREIVADWQSQYGYRPLLLETFVEQSRQTSRKRSSMTPNSSGLTHRPRHA